MKKKKRKGKGWKKRKGRSKVSYWRKEETKLREETQKDNC